MTRKEAIEILEDSSCAFCGVGSNSMADCDYPKCELKNAVIFAIKSMELWDDMLKDLKKRMEILREQNKEKIKEAEECDKKEIPLPEFSLIDSAIISSKIAECSDFEFVIKEYLKELEDE